MIFTKNLKLKDGNIQALNAEHSSSRNIQAFTASPTYKQFC